MNSKFWVNFCIKFFGTFLKNIDFVIFSLLKKGEESTNSRHFAINSWIIPFRFIKCKNDEFALFRAKMTDGVFLKFNTFAKKPKNFQKL